MAASQYKGSTKDGVIRLSDNKFIARNKDDPEWQAVQQYLAGGGALDAADAAVLEYQWYIDIGPFFDRFGTAKMNVLTSANAVCKAVVQDVAIRKWIDLKNPAVSAGLDALISVGIPGVDATLKSYIINTPVSTAEQSALVKMFFHTGK